MTVDERALRALHAHLEEVLGVDDAAQVATLLNNVATKDDIAELREELRRDLERFATKDDLERFATKDDLERFATKDDLDAFVTKEHLSSELQRFATKEHLSSELQRFATKEQLTAELSSLEERLTLRMDGQSSELLATVRGEFVIQLRAMFIGLVTVLVAIAGLGITLVTAI